MTREQVDTIIQSDRRMALWQAIIQYARVASQGAPTGPFNEARDTLANLIDELIPAQIKGEWSVLMPMEPTDRMVNAGVELLEGDQPQPVETIKAIYKAMMEAS